jgi:hypothetical protein
MNNYQYAVAALIELKNDALLLSVANNHLRDEIYLTKIGASISHAVEILKRDISSLKKEYPGKLMNDVDTDPILEKIDKAARHMLKPGEEIKKDYLSGELGRVMESYVASITRAVDDIRMKIQGAPADHVGEGSAINLWDRVRQTSQSAGHVVLVGAKLLAGVTVMVAAVFSYLYFTMEKDTPILNEITTSQTEIIAKKQLVSKLERERQDLYSNRKPQTGKESREEKVAILDIEMKIKKVEESLDQTEAEIYVQEKKLNENLDKLGALREKPFMKRLLKQ